MYNKHTLPTNFVLTGKNYQYRIVKVLGQGSFGITYLAYLIINGQLGSINSCVKVAIKEFFMREINGRMENSVTCGNNGGMFAKYKKKFVQEAENLSKFDHPNIVKVLELIKANNTVYYVMEYIDGGNLNEYIELHHGLSETESLKYFKGISSALSYMHENNMLHLDLKPSNIMLRGDGEPVLIDFGLSKQFDENGEPESSTTIGGGTPGYAPIEQSSYHGKVGFPITMDVYALGATLFKMLTGQRPPEASVILNDGFPVRELQNRNVNEHTISCILKSMEPFRKSRYQTISSFAFSLYENKCASSEEETLEAPISEDASTVHDGISIICYDPAIGKLIILDNNEMLFVDFGDIFHCDANGKVRFHQDFLKRFCGSSCIKYNLLSEQVAKTGLLNESQKKRFIIAYESEIDYCELSKFAIKLFGKESWDFGVRLISKTTLAALYYAVSENDDLVFKIQRRNDFCFVEYGSGVIEIMSYDIGNASSKTILSESSIDYLAGAALQLSILEGFINDYVLFNELRMEIGVLVSDKKYELIKKYTSFPCHGSKTIGKDNAEKLEFYIDEHVFEWKIPSCFKDDMMLECSADIDANQRVRFEVKSKHSGISRVIRMQDLLFCPLRSDDQKQNEETTYICI